MNIIMNYIENCSTLRTGIDHLFGCMVRGQIGAM